MYFIVHNNDDDEGGGAKVDTADTLDETKIAIREVLAGGTGIDEQNGLPIVIEGRALSIQITLDGE